MSDFFDVIDKIADFYAVCQMAYGFYLAVKKIKDAHCHRHP